jgi:hypothetical protein
MDEFEQLLLETLRARPGMNRERLAGLMNMTSDDAFREKLSDAIDKDIIHKIQDKYFPGTRKSY